MSDTGRLRIDRVHLAARTASTSDVGGMDVFMHDASST